MKNIFAKSLVLSALSLLASEAFSFSLVCRTDGEMDKIVRIEANLENDDTTIKSASIEMTLPSGSSLVVQELPLNKNPDNTYWNASLPFTGSITFDTLEKATMDLDGMLLEFNCYVKFDQAI